MTKKGLCLSGLLCIIQSGSHRTRRILRSETQDKEWSGGIQTMGNGLSVRTQTMVGESRFFTSPRPSPLVAGGRKRFGKSRFMCSVITPLQGLGAHSKLSAQRDSPAAGRLCPFGACSGPSGI
jgi:hypothetical protein